MRVFIGPLSYNIVGQYELLTANNAILGIIAAAKEHVLEHVLENLLCR